MWALALVLLVIGIVTPGSGGPIDVGSAIVTTVVLLLATLPAVTAGTILVTRLPSNLVGSCATGCTRSTGSSAGRLRTRS
jgi:hypothetical protein